MNIRTYNELITEEKDNPESHFNKTFTCLQCGKGYYERWIKIEEGIMVYD